MPQLLCMGAFLKCAFGSSSVPLTVLPTNKVSGILPYANSNDHVPMLNILPFGTCSSPSNPAVIAAQGASVPCTPMTVTPWSNPAQKVCVGASPAITTDSSLMCVFMGKISPDTAGQLNVFGG